MNDQQKGNELDLQEYKERYKENIREIKDIKQKLYPDVRDVKVKIDKDKNPELIMAINSIFGEIDEDDPRYGYITFDMYITCLNILNMAGQAKAQTILSEQMPEIAAV